MARVIALRTDKLEKARRGGDDVVDISALHRRREAVGIVLLAVALFLLLSVASLAAGDGRLMGPVGAWVATTVYSLFGVGSVLCAYGVLVLAVRCLRTAPLRVRPLGVAGMLGVGLSGAMLLHLILGNYRLHGMPPGGAVGEYGAEMTKALIGTAGTALLSLAGLMVSLLGATRLSFRSVLGAAGRLGHGAMGLLTDGVRAVFPTDDEEKEAEREAQDEKNDKDDKAPRRARPKREIAPVAGVPIVPAIGAAAQRKRDEEETQLLATPAPILREAPRPEPVIAQRPEPVIAPRVEPVPPPVSPIDLPKAEAAKGRKKKEARPAPSPAAESNDKDEEDEDAGDPLHGAPTLLDLRDAVPQPVAGKPVPLAEPEPEPESENDALDGEDEQDQGEERDELEDEEEEEEEVVEQPVVVPPPPARPARQVAAAARAAAPVIEAARGKSPEKAAQKLEYVKLGNGAYRMPSIDLLDYKEQGQGDLDRQAMLELAQRLEKTLADYQVKGRVSEIHPGPVVTMYEFVPAPGIKLSKITALSNDLAMALEALRVRIVAPIPGKAAVGIEVPNRGRETVYLKEILADDCFTKAKSKLTLALGKDIAGLPVCVDLAKMPHLLVAGTTGSGKSVSVNGMVSSILFNASPDEVKMIMIDPKMLELSIYEGIPHLLLPVVTDPKKANLALRWAVDEMERRYELISKSGVRDIAGYNKKVEKLLEEGPKQASLLPRFITVRATCKDGAERDVQVYPSEEAVLEAGGVVTDEVLAEISDAIAENEAARERQQETELPRKLPYIVVLIDEFADLMMVASKEVETSVARIAQKARAAGIHLILATQRPSVDVITGLIKANFPSRIAFQVASRIDSRTILDAQGAENLLGMGDMLFTDRGQALRRIHGALITDAEIHKMVEHLKKQGQPIYDMDILTPRGDDDGEEPEEDMSDEMYDQAVRLVAETRQASISMIQRRLRIGYNRAARMVERMEREGIVSAADGAKGREVLIQGL